MSEPVLSVLINTPVTNGAKDPNYRALIPLSSVQQIRQSEKGVVLVQLGGRETLLQGLWMDYYTALSNAPDAAPIIKVATGP